MKTTLRKLIELLQRDRLRLHLSWDESWNIYAPSEDTFRDRGKGLDSLIDLIESGDHLPIISLPVSHRWKYAARDANGRVLLFEKKPHLDGDRWDTEDGSFFTPADILSADIVAPILGIPGVENSLHFIKHV